MSFWSSFCFFFVNNDSKNLLQNLPDVIYSDFFLNLSSRIAIWDKFMSLSENLKGNLL